MESRWPKSSRTVHKQSVMPQEYELPASTSPARIAPGYYMQIRIPVQLSPEGRRRWMEQTAFFEGLKNNAALRKNEEEKAAALADFLKQSRMTIDTSNLQNLNVGGRSLWGQILEN